MKNTNKGPPLVSLSSRALLLPQREETRPGILPGGG